MNDLEMLLALCHEPWVLTGMVGWVALLMRGFVWGLSRSTPKRRWWATIVAWCVGLLPRDIPFLLDDIQSGLATSGAMFSRWHFPRWLAPTVAFLLAIVYHTWATRKEARKKLPPIFESVEMTSSIFGGQ